jgi:hypothetical protein
MLAKRTISAIGSIAAGAAALLTTATVGMCQEKSKSNASSPSVPAETKAIQEKTKAIQAKLEKPIPMKFVEETPFEDVLKYVDNATRDAAKKGPKNRGIPIYVEPKGMRDVDRGMNSTIRNIDLAGRPLRVTLKRVVTQLHLDFIVKDGVLFISSANGIARERKALPVVVGDESADTNDLIKILDQPLSMSFNEETSLGDVVNYIKAASKKGPNDPGIQIDFDLDGLKQAHKTMTSTIRNVDFEGVPLKTSLRLLLTQLDLAYIVKDGIVVVSSPEGVQKLKAENNK